MRNILDDLQSRLAEVIESLHAEGTVNPREGNCVSHPKAKKNILWFLDSFAGAVAGARLHLGRVEADNDYTESDKAEVRARITKRLEWVFSGLTPVIDDYFNCQQNHFVGPETLDHEPAGDDMEFRRRIVTETLEELRLLEKALGPLREELRGCIAQPVE